MRPANNATPRPGRRRCPPPGLLAATVPPWGPLRPHHGASGRDHLGPQRHGWRRHGNRCDIDVSSQVTAHHLKNTMLELPSPTAMFWVDYVRRRRARALRYNIPSPPLDSAGVEALALASPPALRQPVRPICKWLSSPELPGIEVLRLSPPLSGTGGGGWSSLDTADTMRTAGRTGDWAHNSQRHVLT
jgi:hypothetical protein